MSTIGTNSEDLILNADGSGSDIKFKSNGTEVGSISDGGVMTATSFAGSGANLTGVADATKLPLAGGAMTGDITSSSDFGINVTGDATIKATSDVIYQSTSGNGPAGHHIFKAYNTQIMKVNATNDNVLIGTGVVTPSHNSRLFIGQQGTTPLLELKVSHTSAYGCVKFQNDNGEVGSIGVSANSTNYATSSDYRLKENVDYTWDATTRLKQLKPARFNFIADDTNTLVDGFIAHEVSSIVPEAVTGEKDAVDDEGNAVHQGIDQSKLVPLLVKTIQELEARIAALES